MSLFRKPPTGGEKPGNPPPAEPSRRSAWQAPPRPGRPAQSTEVPPKATPAKQAVPRPAPPVKPPASYAAKPVARPPSPGAPTATSKPTASTPKTPSQASVAARPPAQAHASPLREASRHRGSFRVPFHRGDTLISRGERTLFWTLLAAVIAMSIFFVRYREHVDAHFQSRAMAVPLSAAGAASLPGSAAEPLLLYLANDDTGALIERPLAFLLPDDPNTRARVILEKLLSEYTAPGSPHPLKPAAPGVESVDEVYLAPVSTSSHALLAVVDLTPEFVHTHPSGIEPETLTLLSMIATLHANMPAVTQVRFLVDGEPRATLAGHADLSRTYLAGAAQMAPGEAFTTRAGTP